MTSGHSSIGGGPPARLTWPCDPQAAAGASCPSQGLLGAWCLRTAVLYMVQAVVPNATWVTMAH